MHVDIITHNQRIMLLAWLLQPLAPKSAVGESNMYKVGTAPEDAVGMHVMYPPTTFPQYVFVTL
jgi:hypothetical protein